MSYTDKIFIQNCKDILSRGVWDKDLSVRPRWDDGTPAHTIKLFGVVNRYDLRKEFPIMTLRRTAFKGCIDELLWIWQKKSNDIRQLKSHIWDTWADENGTIGKAYGYQLGVKHQYSDGMFDQVDRILKDLRENPASSWNVCQYAILIHMMAQASGLEAGELVHVIADCHIYDRHVPIVEQLIQREPRPAPHLVIDPDVKNFYNFTADSFQLEGYDPHPFDEKIEVAV